MIKKNNLTLKALQQQIEDLKTQNLKDINTRKENVEVKGKNNNVTITTKGLIHPVLWLISVAITNLHKIPGVSSIVTALSLWYGRTTWWRMLVLLRKVFVLINALIGILAVIKISGFSLANVMLGLYSMGITYVDMLSSLVSRLFNWLYSFFDRHTPQPPKSGWSWFRSDIRDFRETGPQWFPWNMKPMQDQSIADPIMKLAKDQTFYKHPLKYVDTQSVQTGWSLVTWAWITGISLLVLGTLYLGYVIYTDPDTAKAVWPIAYWGKTTGRPQPPAPPTIIEHGFGFGPEIVVNEEENTAGIMGVLYNKVAGLPRSIGRALNPYTYFATSDQVRGSVEAWYAKQADATRADFSYYPYTDNNPAAPLYKQWIQAIFGESEADKFVRQGQMNAAFNAVKPPIASVIPSGARTPLTGLGIGISSALPGNTPADFINAAELSHRLNTLPETPNMAPLGSTPPMANTEVWLRDDRANAPAYVREMYEDVMESSTQLVTSAWESKKGYQEIVYSSLNDRASAAARLANLDQGLTAHMAAKAAHAASMASQQGAGSLPVEVVTPLQHAIDVVAPILDAPSTPITDTTQATLVNSPITLPEVVLPVVATAGVTHAIQQVLDSVPVEVVTPLQHAIDVVAPIVDTVTRPLLEIPNALVDLEDISDYEAVFEYIKEVSKISSSLGDHLQVESLTTLMPVQKAVIDFLDHAARITTGEDLLDAKALYIEHLQVNTHTNHELVDAINLANSGVDPLFTTLLNRQLETAHGVFNHISEQPEGVLPYMEEDGGPSTPTETPLPDNPADVQVTQIAEVSETTTTEDSQITQHARTDSID